MWVEGPCLCVCVCLPDIGAVLRSLGLFVGGSNFSSLYHLSKLLTETSTAIRPINVTLLTKRSCRAGQAIEVAPEAIEITAILMSEAGRWNKRCVGASKCAPLAGVCIGGGCSERSA